MALPSVSQYIESLGSSHILLSTLGGCEIERDAYNSLKVRTGNSAAVFKIFIDGQPYALRCPIKEVLWQHEKYEYISRAALQTSYLPSVQLLPCELLLFDHLGEAHYHDLVITQWVEGQTLDQTIRSAQFPDHNIDFRSLAQKFDALAVDLLSQPWAHGDLKPENIVVDKQGDLKLIDFDAVFIPSLAGHSTNEIGTPLYQHPLRGVEMYDRNIDDYSIAVISSLLHTLAGESPLPEHEAMLSSPTPHLPNLMSLLQGAK